MHGHQDRRHPAFPLGIAGILSHEAHFDSGIVTAFEFYFDESGKEPRSKYYIIAGVAAEAGAWRALVDKWRRALRAHPSIEYFKMTEAINLRRQFDKRRGWTHQLAAEKAEHLTQLLGEYAGFYSLVRCHKLQYQASKLTQPVPGLPHKLDYPYFPCFWDSMRIVGAFMERNKRGARKPAVTLDSQPEHELEAHQLFAVLKAKGKDRNSGLRRDARWLSGIAFEDDKKVLPLQAADVVAWHCNRYHKDVWDERPNAPFISQMRRVPFFGTAWNMNTIDGWRRNLPGLLRSVQSNARPIYALPLIKDRDAQTTNALENVPPPGHLESI